MSGMIEGPVDVQRWAESHRGDQDEATWQSYRRRLVYQREDAAAERTELTGAVRFGGFGVCALWILLVLLATGTRWDLPVQETGWPMVGLITGVVVAGTGTVAVCLWLVDARGARERARQARRALEEFDLAYAQRV